ncbi:hypothetical protein BT96DRAFT_1011533 [Gymnopus androsaceus JB14]|uniref:Cytochrome c domain-containing protein n=1 Tax=Gymnopus androsaceus JB14 TaxID=1447944 RepID=A0A6A4IMV4_9AGAR|nr:hypothetical protein BT96DRAFT_1011533 [Gymnopus androsaceus JB14]
MFAFSRFFAAALFLVALIIADNSVVARPIQVARSAPSGSFTGATGSANGGNVTPNDECAECHGGIVSNPILNFASDNGGEAGETESGNALLFGAPGSKGSGSGSFTGSTGNADGGSTSATNGLINLCSGNGGDAGSTKSGNAISRSLCGL